MRQPNCSGGIIPKVCSIFMLGNLPPMQELAGRSGIANNIPYGNGHGNKDTRLMIVKRPIRTKALLTGTLMVFALFGRPVLAAEAARVPDNVRLADDLVPAPFGYEPV